MFYSQLNPGYGQMIKRLVSGSRLENDFQLLELYAHVNHGCHIPASWFFAHADTLFTQVRLNRGLCDPSALCEAWLDSRKGGI